MNSQQKVDGQLTNSRQQVDNTAATVRQQFDESLTEVRQQINPNYSKAPWKPQDISDSLCMHIMCIYIYIISNSRFVARILSNSCFLLVDLQELLD